MAENKTKPTAVTADDFLAAVEPGAKRDDAMALRVLMQTLSGEPAIMWGSSIVGFGSCHYRYESGREGDMPRVAFAPRKAELVLYGLGGADRHPELIARLGKHTTGKGCVYIKRLADVDMAVLEALIAASLVHHTAS